jgi:Protein of unknown function (DUF3040)
MALSMDEQRMLDEMERKLAVDDPLLASRLSSFGHPGLAAVLRSPRTRLLLALAALVVIAVVALVVYAVGPFRSGPGRPSPDRSAVPHGVMRQLPAPRGSVTGAPIGSLAP